MNKQLDEHALSKLLELVGKQQKDEIIQNQSIQIENMTQVLLNARKKIFGRSSEVTSQIDGQLNVFETTVQISKELFSEQKKITVSTHKRKARQLGIRKEMLENRKSIGENR